MCSKFLHHSNSIKPFSSLHHKYFQGTKACCLDILHYNVDTLGGYPKALDPKHWIIHFFFFAHSAQWKYRGRKGSLCFSRLSLIEAFKVCLHKLAIQHVPYTKVRLKAYNQRSRGRRAFFVVGAHPRGYVGFKENLWLVSLQLYRIGVMSAQMK